MPFQLGSISTGALRTDDLLLAFANKLDRLNTKSEAGYEWLFNEAYRLNRCRNAPQQECDDRLKDLQDALQEFCPPFVYFGAHSSDGADFGFWPDVDRIVDELGGDPANEVDYVLDNFKGGSCIVRFANGNPCVMDMERAVIWSIV